MSAPRSGRASSAVRRTSTAGQRIAFASVGARLRDGRSGEWSVLKPARIRGVESAGMVASEKELDLSEDHETILVLPEDAPVGAPLSDYLGDTIFDLEITPNRPDLLSLLGVAWEAGAQTGTKVSEPERAYAETASASAAQRASVTIDDRDLCSRYLAGIVERVKVGPSPGWLQERLSSAGLRPINNVVDITNYVMLEMGQPLHAFDFRKLAGGSIIVRRARPGRAPPHPRRRRPRTDARDACHRRREQGRGHRRASWAATPPR